MPRHIVRDIPGTSIRNLQSLANKVFEIGEQASAALNPDTDGLLFVDQGMQGQRISFHTPPGPALRVYEVASEWYDHKYREDDPGPTQGNAWWAYAYEVVYYSEQNQQTGDRITYWAKKDEPLVSESLNEEVGGGGNGSGGITYLPLTQIWHAEGGEETDGSGSGSGSGSTTPGNAPTSEIGDWLVCFWDVAASVWRVILTTAASLAFKRFVLTSNLELGGTASATVLSVNPDRSTSPTAESIIVFDPFCEFYGVAHSAWGIAYRLNDTPSGYYEVMRITCPGFQGCPAGY